MRLNPFRPPLKPEGAVIVRSDGTRLNVELVYRGRRRGLDQWWIAGAVLRPGDSLLVDTLPGRTVLGGAADPSAP